MKFTDIHSDLASEIRELHKLSDVDGVTSETFQNHGISVNRTNIKTESAADATGKPMGKYAEIDYMGAFSCDETFNNAADVIAEELSSLISSDISKSALVVGLGNRHLTSDSIGPRTTDGVIITRHLKNNLPEIFSSMPLRELSCINPGVLGRTGIESNDIICAVVKAAKPSAVIIIDALAARNPAKLCSVVQMSNTGISPGSGIGNTRTSISEKTLGVPVISVGVPTVISASTLSADIISNFIDKLKAKNENLYNDVSAALENVDDDDHSCSKKPMIVTPSDIDTLISKTSRLLATALNKALHGNLESDEINALLNA